MPYAVKNAVWKKLFRVLRTIPGIHLRHKRRVRRFIDAVLYVCRSGCHSPGLRVNSLKDTRVLRAGLREASGKNSLKTSRMPQITRH
jgi:hypothetical protein